MNASEIVTGLKELGVEITEAAAQVLIDNEYESVQQILAHPMTESGYLQLGLKGRSAASLAAHVAKKSQPTPTVTPSALPQTVILKRDESEIPLTDRSWEWLLEKLLENLEDESVMAALLSKPEIRKASHRTNGKFAFKKTDKTFDMEETKNNIRLLQKDSNPPRQRLSDRRTPTTLKDALGISNIILLHPVKYGETLFADGTDSEGLNWLNPAVEGWQPDYALAMFWASGLSGHGAHHPYVLLHNRHIDSIRTISI